MGFFLGFLGLNPVRLYRKLFAFYGPQGWWPVSNRRFGKATYAKREKLNRHQQLEVCVGSILAQNTAWSNAAKAIERLKQDRLLDLETLATCSQARLANCIRSAGFFNQKALRLKLFCRHVLKRDGSISVLLNQPVEDLRSELVSLHGIGPETCDSMMLYAGQKPVFVVDAYTLRLVDRLYALRLDYAAGQAFFQSSLPDKAGLFNEFHGLIVEHSKAFCRSKPDCKGCFLKKNCKWGQKSESGK